MYLTYEEYLQRGGTMAEADFATAELGARKRIDRLTDGRVAAMAAVPEAVKVAMMAVIAADGAVGAEAQASAPPLIAFEADGYSERYGGPGERTAAVEGQLNAALRRLLWGERDDGGVPLLYRGVM